MLCFPTEIIQRIIEEVGFEYSPQLKEYISTFKALNSIPELKPIIARYISIWVSIPSKAKFNYLRHSETLRSLRDCTDSFFIITNDDPLYLAKIDKGLETEGRKDPLIFDVHNYLGMKLKDGLNLAIRNPDVVVENLFLLSDQRPKRILELVLPRSQCQNRGENFKFTGCIDLYCLRRGVIADGTTGKSTAGIPVGKRYSVPIDHQTFDWAKIDVFDEYPFDKSFRDIWIDPPVITSTIDFLSMDREFWGPTPFLDGLSFYDIHYAMDCTTFETKFEKCRAELWSDYQNQLFLGEYCRLTMAAYHDLIETLATEQWE